MPIDIATGNVRLEHQDTLISGKMDLIWERYYSGTFRVRQGSPLGPGWISHYDVTLTRRADGFEFVTSSGSVELLPDPEDAVSRGEVIRHLGAYLEIFMEHGTYVVQGWDVESGGVWRYCFSRGIDGQILPVTAIEDRTGLGLDLIRDHDGRLVAVRQRLEKRALRLNYYPNGLLHTLTLHSSNGESHPQVSYEYDVEGRLTAAIDARGCATRYEYDTDGRLTREIAKHGGVFFYRYDDEGRCIWYSGLDRYDEKRLRFLDSARMTEITDSYGGTSRYQYLPSGQIVKEWNPLGAETSTEYDTHGRIIARTTPTGSTARYTYDERGNRWQLVNALGYAYELSFNDQHQAIALKDPNRQVWLRHYDEHHRLIGTADPLGGRWAMQYDSDGNMIALTNPKGATRRFHYQDGVLAQSTDWLGNITSLRYDALGRLTTRVDPLGHTFHYRYDAMGNPVQVVFPDGEQIYAEYSATGDLTRLTDAAGRVTTRRYGPCRRLLQTKDPNGNSVSYEWGTEPGRMERVINELGEVYQFVSNLAGDCIEEIGFDGRRLQFAYDLAGGCIRKINGAGETIEMERDLMGRIVAQTLPDGQVLRFAYDPLGNLIEAANDVRVLRLERDATGRLVREVQGEHWVKYTLDALGETTRLETNLGVRVDWELDPNSLWSNLSTNDGHTMQFRRDARGQEIERLLPGGLALDQKSDTLGRMMQQRLGPRGAGPLQSDPAKWIKPTGHAPIRRNYTRDSSGLVTGMSDRFSGSTHYVYDPARRLLEAAHDHTPSQRFEYDATGDLTRSVSDGQDGIKDQIRTYGPGGRLLSMGSTRYEHDGQGRLVRKIERADTEQPKVWIYEWDALDHLRAVTRPDGQVWQYDYDAFGRRVRKVGRDKQIQFVWSGHVPIHEVSSEDENCVYYLFEQHSFVPLAQIRNHQLYPVIPDHLGTPQEIVDGKGQVVWQHRGKAYGGTDLEKTRGIEQPFRFQGHYYDLESCLHYNYHRYYAPEEGRYISADPLRLLGGTNLYYYVFDPINWIDPFGLQATFCAATGRWRDRNTGKFVRRPTDPSQLVHNGQIDHNDIQAWAAQGGPLPNNWGPDPARFPTGGFRYTTSDGTYNYAVWGHGVDPNAVANYPGSNAAASPTTSIQRTPVTGPPRENYMAGGNWAPFNTDPNAAHIPLTNSPY